MPTYQVTDPATGKRLRLTGDSPPTEQELEGVFAGALTPAPVAKPSFIDRAFDTTPAPYPKPGEASASTDTMNVLGNAAKDLLSAGVGIAKDPSQLLRFPVKVAAGAVSSLVPGKRTDPYLVDAENTFSQTFSAPTKEQLYEHPLGPAMAFGLIGGAMGAKTSAPQVGGHAMDLALAEKYRAPETAPTAIPKPEPVGAIRSKAEEMLRGSVRYLDRTSDKDVAAATRAQLDAGGSVTKQGKANILAEKNRAGAAKQAFIDSGSEQGQSVPAQGMYDAIDSYAKSQSGKLSAEDLAAIERARDHVTSIIDPAFKPGVAAEGDIPIAQLDQLKQALQHSNRDRYAAGANPKTGQAVEMAVADWAKNSLEQLQPGIDIPNQAYHDLTKAGQAVSKRLRQLENSTVVPGNLALDIAKRVPAAVLHSLGIGRGALAPAEFAGLLQRPDVRSRVAIKLNDWLGQRKPFEYPKPAPKLPEAPTGTPPARGAARISAPASTPSRATLITEARAAGIAAPEKMGIKDLRNAIDAKKAEPLKVSPDETSPTGHRDEAGRFATPGDTKTLPRKAPEGRNGRPSGDFTKNENARNNEEYFKLQNEGGEGYAPSGPPLEPFDIHEQISRLRRISNATSTADPIYGRLQAEIKDLTVKKLADDGWNKDSLPARRKEWNDWVISFKARGKKITPSDIAAKEQSLGWMMSDLKEAIAHEDGLPATPPE